MTPSEEERYRHRVLQAARRQGLTVLLTRLEQIGCSGTYENTGGFCMALVCPVLAEDGSEEYVVATKDGHFYVARYTMAEWYEGDYSVRGLPIPHTVGTEAAAAAMFKELCHDRAPHAESFDMRGV